MIYDSLYDWNDRLLGAVHGVYIGIVTDNKDPEELGRVKVNIPVLEDAAVLDWARVAVFMAGKDRGTLFIPEVGDEVLVAFIMGDLRKPIVTGSLWNKEMAPPKGKNNQNNIRKIKTKSGHEIVFDDAGDDGKITISTSKGHLLEISDKQDEIMLADKSKQNVLKISGSANSIELKSGSSILKMDNRGAVTVESMKSMQVKAAQITLEASATLDLKASAALTIKSDGIVAIKGSMINLN